MHNKLLKISTTATKGSKTMNSQIRNINAVELSNDELDTVAGGFASNTNISKSISDAFKGVNLPFPQPSFINFDGFRSDYNVNTQDSTDAVTHPISLV